MTMIYNIFLLILNEWLVGLFVFVRNCILRHTFLLNACKGFFKNLVFHKVCDTYFKLVYGIKTFKPWVCPFRLHDLPHNKLNCNFEPNLGLECYLLFDWYSETLWLKESKKRKLIKGQISSSSWNRIFLLIVQYDLMVMIILDMIRVSNNSRK